MFFLLTDHLSKIPGIGLNLSQKLAEMGLVRVQDLLSYYPRKWEDFSHLSPIVEAQKGAKSTFRATLLTISQFRPYHRKLHIINAIFSDESGSIRVTWFNQPYLINSLQKERLYFLNGMVKRYQGKLTLVSPNIEKADDDKSPLHSGRIVAVYPETSGITSKLIRKTINYLVPTMKSIPETLPEIILKSHKLMGLSKAVASIHSPTSEADLVTAKTRLSYEELIPIHLSLIQSQKIAQSEPGLPIKTTKKNLPEFLSHLNFELTPSQKTAINEVLADLATPHPSNRLILGDVGSGKTVVAAAALAASAKAGFQSALMAPTEILANQHYQSLTPLLNKLGISSALMTSSHKSHSYEDIASGRVDIVIGTHALIAQKITFANLNLVIIDEQHRFGVRQREKLKNKSAVTAPHFISLSATPIPRTLFLHLLKDLNVSFITHLPVGRLPVITRLATINNFAKVKMLINQEISKGHKIFVVTPRIHEDLTGKTEKASVILEKQKIAKLFPMAKIGMLHGQLVSEVKLKTLTDLKDNKLDILVSTSMIEVGIDIPEATVILIKNAEQFGLAGLHQLRGRVGRSSHQSYCLIETNSDNPEAIERLTSLIKINDGNKLAEMDLKFRGPGGFFTDQQSGFLKLKLTDLTDQKLIKATRKIAEEIIADDPNLKYCPELKKKLQFNYLTHSE